jgi:pyruvate,water dikinase
MTEVDDKSLESLLRDLKERAKELNCLYRVDELLDRTELDFTRALEELLQAIPPGWQYPEICIAEIVLEGGVYRPAGFRETPWGFSAPIVSEGETIGRVAVYYTEPKPEVDEGPFLKEERRLINAIAERIGYRVLQRRLKAAVAAAGQADVAGKGRPWTVIVDFLRVADRALLQRITRRMINYLCWSGVEGADALLSESLPAPLDAASGQDNRPQQRTEVQDLDALAARTVTLAAAHLREDEVLRRIQSWINEDKAAFLYSAAEHLDAPLTQLAAAVDRFHGLSIDERDLPEAMRRGLRVNLIRRFFSDQLDFINSAKDVTRVSDFYDLVHRMILTPESRGKLGGKSAGLFLASRIVREADEHRAMLENLRVPKTWYIPSDALLEFLRHNNLQEVYDRKYREIDLIRQDYPYLVQAFKAAQFPPEMTKGLAAALDDFENRPLIVRSSSLLEDRVGAAFSGKYKSLFLGNQGTKRERIAALQDAIAEVYASVFGPDPIEYRAERGLLDVHEEMGVMIQEVVGTSVGPYFLPAFSGVAYSNAEYRWSSRIRREDGLVRLVPGLGTRAVDRLSDDYPVLIAPGQPGLRVNQSPDEIMRYSPRRIDLINLETNRFETVEVGTLLHDHGTAYPAIRQLVVQVSDAGVRRPTGLSLDFATGETAITFEGLIADTPFVRQIRTLLDLLQQRMGVPVDVEFASDGTHLFLLQCRPQGFGGETAPTAIPRDLPRDRILFTADRYVSNGRVPDVTHVVYVAAAAYAALPSPRLMQEVGETVGRLNRLLPKRQFILMGPGRWGSRGDITLGVPVTYSQINNTAMLIEVARRKDGHVPDLSFGTHFFQDLVEAEIRYLPLYPDDPGIVFNEAFFQRAHNVLPELLPDVAHLAPVLRVIDIGREFGDKVLRVLLNADLDEAVGVVSTPSAQPATAQQRRRPPSDVSSADHWRWRLVMAERIAAAVDPERFGVRAMYVIGSTKNATAGPASDLDLIVHVTDHAPRDALDLWLDGWSRCLAEMNYLRTGYQSDGLLDIHYVRDADLAAQSSFAVKIGAVTDPAKALPLGRAAPTRPRTS